jgi:hypothetical protein
MGGLGGTFYTDARENGSASFRSTSSTPPPKSPQVPHQGWRFPCSIGDGTGARLPRKSEKNLSAAARPPRRCCRALAARSQRWRKGGPSNLGLRANGTESL